MFPTSVSRFLTSSAVAVLAIAALACGSPAPTTPSPIAPTPSVAPTPTPATPSPVTASPSPSPTSSPPAAPAQLLLEVTSEGGFINPSARIGQLPLVVVDTEGRIYTPDSAATGDLLVPAVVVRDVGPTGAEQILTAMNAAGLDSEGSDGGIVADTGVTVFTAEIDGQEIINRIAAGGPPGPGNPGGADSAALDLLARLTDPSETWGAADVTSLPFDPQVYRVFSAPADAAAGAPVDWPLDQPLADFGAPRTPDFGVTGLRSGIVLGNDAVTLGDALADLPADTMIESDGQSFQVWVEPILPPVAG